MRPIRYGKLAILVGSVLLIPLFGNFFIEGWNWNAGGFVFAGGLFYATGLAYELMTRRSDVREYRLAIGVAVTTCLGILWANPAAGIINEDNPANVYYYLIIAIAIVGTALSRLKPRGMSLTMFLMAAMAMVIPLISYLGWPHNFPADWARLFVGHVILIGLLTAAGVFFWRSKKTVHLS